MLVAPPPADDANVIAAGWLFRGLVLALIERETDPAEKKARIMIAREHGHLTDQEAEEWIVLAGLEAA
jgi:hypothetical protein